MGNNIDHQFYGGDYVAELLDTIMTWLHSTESVEILLRSKLQNCNRYFVEGTLDIEMVDFHNQLPGLFGQ